jgi:hypothetical protein
MFQRKFGLIVRNVRFIKIIQSASIKQVNAVRWQKVNATTNGKRRVTADKNTHSRGSSPKQPRSKP